MSWKIVDWDKHYENSRTSPIELRRWATLPNKQHGLTYCKLLADDNGESMYGAFCALICMLSRQSPPRDGWVTDNGMEDGVALSADDVALVTKFRTETVSAMLDVCGGRLGWMQWYGEGTAKEPTAKPDSVKRPVRIARAARRDDKPWMQHVQRIYAAYPRKVGKKAAESAILKALKSGAIKGVPEDTLLERVNAYALAVSKWADDDMAYIPYPATWFNQARWEDDPETWKRGDKTSRALDRRRDVKKENEEKQAGLIAEYKGKIIAENRDGWMGIVSEATDRGLDSEGFRTLDAYCAKIAQMRDEEGNTE